MGRVVEDLHVKYGGESAEPLRTDTKRVDLVVELDAQRLDRGLGTARLEIGHVDRVHQ